MSSPLTNPFPLPGAEVVLEEHATFLSSLARALVGDPGAADDLAQETLIASAQSGEVQGRPWLATVLRRKASNRFRSEQRRRGREEEVARNEALGSALDSAGRLELAQRLIQLVQELDGPVRDAIVGRFYRGLTFKALAAESGAPVTTVKSRVDRGVELLKERLSAEQSGGREVWLGAVAALILPSGAGATAANGGGSSGAATAGGLGSLSLLKSALAITLGAAAIGLGVLGWQHFDARSGFEEAELASLGEGRAAAASGLGATPRGLGTSLGVSADKSVAAVSLHGGANAESASSQADETLGRQVLSVAGQPDCIAVYLDADGVEQSAAGVKVSWSATGTSTAAVGTESGRLSGLGYASGDAAEAGDRATSMLAAPSPSMSGESFADENGCVSLDLPSTATSLRVSLPPDQAYRGDYWEGTPEEWLAREKPLRLVRVPHGALAGSVVDTHGRPLAGVRVTARVAFGGDGNQAAVTGQDGVFSIERAARAYTLAAELSGWMLIERKKPVELEAGGWEEQELVMSRRGTLRLDLGPSEVEKRDVAALITFENHHRLADAGPEFVEGSAGMDGVVELDGLPAGQRLMLVVGRGQPLCVYQKNGVIVPGYSEGDAPPVGATPIVIPESGRLELTVPEVLHRTVHGRVVDEDGGAVAGARVSVGADWVASPFSPPGPRMQDAEFGRAKADEQGLFSMTVAGAEGLPSCLFRAHRPGAHRPGGSARGGDRGYRVATLDEAASKDGVILVLTGGIQAVGKVTVSEDAPNSSPQSARIRWTLVEPAKGDAYSVVATVANVSGRAMAADGGFEVDLPVEGRYRVQATHPRYVALEFDVQVTDGDALKIEFKEARRAEVALPERRTEVALSLSPAVDVMGRVVAGPREDLSGLALMVMTADGREPLKIGRGPLGRASSVVALSRRGAFRFNIPEGTYRVLVGTDQELAARRPRREHRLVVPAGGSDSFELHPGE